jgi:hypothetical protein
MSTGLELASRSAFAHNASSWAFVGHEQPYLTARICYGPCPEELLRSRLCAVVAALQRVDRGSRDLDDLIDDRPYPLRQPARYSAGKKSDSFIQPDTGFSVLV